MLKSLVIAFSTYSKIPMPRVDWDEKSMKHSMCFFPLVGAVVGGVFMGIMYLLWNNNYNFVMSAAILTAIPVLITGGIHVDGFLDTVDAKSSYKDKEEKLKILKDPHTGAFAIIFAIVYFLLYFGFMTQLVCDFSDDNMTCALLVAIGFVYSRTLSGLSVVSFKKAKQDGIVSSIAKASTNGVKSILLVELGACVAGLIIVDPIRGAIVAATGILTFVYYKLMAYKTFGGITGDLAGYFLQLCELLILVACAL